MKSLFPIFSIRHWQSLVFILTLGVGLSACACTTWKEEVALYDGTKIIVTRSPTRGGRHEIGQEVPVAEHTMVFANPKSRQRITWKSTYGIKLAAEPMVSPEPMPIFF